MIIFLAGLPGAGKTSILDGIDGEIICPDMFNFESNQEDEHETHHKFAMWELSIEFLVDRAKKAKEDDVIIFDTCCCNKKMTQILNEINHPTIVIYVNTSKENCAARTDIDMDLIKKYIKKFVGILPELKKNADKFYVINNNGNKKVSTDRLKEIIDENLRI